MPDYPMKFNCQITTNHIAFVEKSPLHVSSKPTYP